MRWITCRPKGAVTPSVQLWQRLSAAKHDIEMIKLDKNFKDIVYGGGNCTYYQNFVSCLTIQSVMLAWLFKHNVCKGKKTLQNSGRGRSFRTGSSVVEQRPHKPKATSSILVRSTTPFDRVVRWRSAKPYTSVRFWHGCLNGFVTQW